MIQDLSNKVINLETELAEVKKKNVNVKRSEVSDKFKKVENDESKKEKEVRNESKKEVPKETTSSKIKEDSENVSNPKKNKVSVFRFGDVAQQTFLSKKKPEEKEIETNNMKCQHCDYKCQKNSTMTKHIKLRHSEHQCKRCSEKFK